MSVSTYACLLRVYIRHDDESYREISVGIFGDDTAFCDLVCQVSDELLLFIFTHVGISFLQPLVYDLYDLRRMHVCVYVHTRACMHLHVCIA